MIADENDGGRQHFIFFEIAKKMLNGKVKICIEKVKKLLKIFERLKMLKC